MSTIPMTRCPSWCDRSHETRTTAGDFVHTTAEFIFPGQPVASSEDIVFTLAELSTENGAYGPGFVSLDGVKLTPSDARRLAIQILQLADVAEER